MTISRTSKRINRIRRWTSRIKCSSFPFSKIATTISFFKLLTRNPREVGWRHPPKGAISRSTEKRQSLGRSVHEECPHCKQYHNPEGVCRNFPKWRNSENFPSYHALYNFYNAKKDIDNSGLIIITESSANTWRLFEAGFTMSVGTFGSKFSDAQKSLLDSSLAQTVIVVPDAGSAGQYLVKHVQEHCQFTHNIITISPSYEDDIGKCNIETVKKIIGPYVDKKLG